MIRKNLTAFAIAFGLLAVVIIINRVSFNKMKEYTAWVGHTREVIISFERLSNHLKSAEIYSKKYSADAKQFYDLYKKEADNLPNEVKQLQALVKDNHNQSQLINFISLAINEQINTLKEKNVSEIIQSGEIWRITKLFQIHELINTGIENEKELLVIRKNRLETSTHYTNILTILFSIVAVLLLIITFSYNIVLVRNRKKLESFLESVLNTSQNAVVTYEAVRERGKIVDFKIEFANAATEHLLGLKPASIIGKQLRQIQSHVRDTDMYDKYITVVETGEMIEFETLYAKDGINIWLHVVLAKLEDGLTATFHNITDLKNYEKELENNILKLERSNKELEEYAYVASHDLQEPLRKIIIYSSLLQNSVADKIDEKGKLHLEKIKNATSRMSVLVRDILNYSGLKKEKSFVETNLSEVLQQVLEDLELLIKQNGAAIHHTSLPVIDAIPLQMNQLFYNLISNALKFTQKSASPAIHITYRQLEKSEIEEFKELKANNIYFEILVKDNGIGFDNQYAEQIFGMFKRLNNKQAFSGSGIGLALCRKIVTNHNGLIYACGNPGEGATFHVILPQHHKE